MKLTETPIFRMYHLTIAAEKREAFLKAGVNNLLTSHQNEPGTLAMYATHLDEKGIDNFVFELYQNEAAYQVHANSSQFKAYGQVAQQAVTGKSLQELRPKYIKTNQVDMTIRGKNDYLLKLTTFKADNQTIEKILNDLSSANESVTYYLAAVDETKQQWLSLELMDGMEVPLLDPTVFEPVTDRKTKLLQVDTLVSQGNILFKGF